MARSKPVVGLIMGSQSDWTTMRHAAVTLEALGVPHEKRIVSAHRTPKRLYAYAEAAAGRGLQVIVAGAGGAAHLPGMVASLTTLPVFGVPIESQSLKGMDSLLSIVQMPGGIPVGTVAIGKPGAINAALLAASVIALQDRKVAKALQAWRERQTRSVAEVPNDDAAHK
ncbi:MAG: 5-(carboxyamino)imidazole ribonucleotide mutase [Reyranellaceae bacterium]